MQPDLLVLLVKPVLLVRLVKLVLLDLLVVLVKRVRLDPLGQVDLQE